MIYYGIRRKAGAGMAIKNYRRFLYDLSEQLGECQREAESVGWHHEEFGTAERSVYNRMCTWQQELGYRMAWYDNTKGRAWKNGIFEERPS